MFKELFRLSELLSIPVVVMLFFVAIFLTVLLRVCSRRRGVHYQEMAAMPLELEGGRR